MQESNASDYVWIGMAVRYLMHAQPGWAANGEGDVVFNYDEFRKTCLDKGLQVTAGAALNELGQLMDELRDQPKDYRLTPGDAAQINDRMLRVNTTLTSEARTLRVFIAVPRRHEVQKLTGDAPALFGAGVFPTLSDIAQYDESQGTRCIAFGLPTAAAFHLLRATEEVLRAFYFNWVRTRRIARPMWGPMVSDMRGRRSHPTEALLNNLDNIRVSFRNPTQHPDKVYDMDEAEDLLGLCVEVINRMTRERRQ